MTPRIFTTHAAHPTLWRVSTLALVLILFGTFKAFAQPGNVCGTPLVVTTLPYDDSGNTGTYGDDYSNSDVPPLATGAITTGTGSDYYLTGDDVVYAYTPSGDQVITISITNPDGWVALWAFTGCPFASTVGYHTSISGTTRTINNLPVQGGTTYYIVISSWQDDPQSTPYALHIELISASTPCTATPTPGATTGPIAVCPGVNFTLGVANPSTDGGITYQWESSTNGTTWVNASGASTSATYTTTQTTQTWYRVQVTCTGNGTGISTPLQVGITPVNGCYCIPTGSTNNTDEILNFTLADLNNTSAPSEGTNGYKDYTGTVAPAHLVAGSSYVASLISNTGSGNHGAAIWIDYNDNGQFEASEKVSLIPLTISGGATVNFPAFTVQNALGQHRLRVQYRYNAAGADLDPCIASTYTETEDYLVEVTGTGPEDCLGVSGGSALPGTPCVATSGFGGMWSATCVCEENVGIEESWNANGVSVFPNPASTELFISTPNNKPVHVKVYNMVGNLVMEMDMTTHLNVAALAPGYYSLFVSDAKGAVQTRTRFMKH